MVRVWRLIPLPPARDDRGIVNYSPSTVKFLIQNTYFETMRRSARVQKLKYYCSLARTQTELLLALTPWHDRYLRMPHFIYKDEGREGARVGGGVTKRQNAIPDKQMLVAECLFEPLLQVRQSSDICWSFSKVGMAVSVSDRVTGWYVWVEVYEW